MGTEWATFEIGPVLAVTGQPKMISIAHEFGDLEQDSESLCSGTVTAVDIRCH